ncbi:putative Lysophospholipid acyltransferase LPEAT1 [Blattamonas nauphoetae]|uniref:Lysophospholipid acyltransferase LPEAT1 n=1 Tax=Blattamonas nauphoetae TaxID=2049346 RepID=A0ABQ9Y2W8_9EUKA|nr:putative Lysophospholipid acyltransferase LPEAT1 [Blattamonas nauphoetae]
MRRNLLYRIATRGKPDPELYEKMKNHPKLSAYLHVYHDLRPLDYFKRLIFPGPLIAIIRILYIIVQFVLFSLLQRIIYFGVDLNTSSKPPARWRRKLSQWSYRLIAFLCLPAAGIFRPEVIDHTKKRPKSKNAEDLPKFEWDQPWCIVATHNSFLDVMLATAYLGFPSTMTKDALFSVPCLGTILKASRSFVQYRNTKKSAPKSSFDQLYERQTQFKENDFTPLIYGEGTVGNGTCIGRFHKGCFVAGLPVRPVSISYPAKHCSMNTDTIEFLPCAYDITCQFVNHMKIEIFDLYIPNEEEKKDPQLYADNVGKLLANAQNIPYRTDVDSRYKFITRDLARGKITWDQAMEKLDELDRANPNNTSTISSHHAKAA